MSVPSHLLKYISVVVFGLSFSLCMIAVSSAQTVAPFARLAGQWSGSGTIELANGVHETIRCRASYDSLREQSNLQLNIRCASASYNFDLRASAHYSAGVITGSWSEATRMVAGSISGRADGDRFQVVATAASFAASLTLITHGGRQSVVIRPHDTQA
ncbi:MAG: hypothetical protein WBG10_06400, partial [Pseudolabrys sp.]